MKITLVRFVSAITLATLSGAAIAQDYEYHPALSDNFLFSAGAFRSDNAIKIEAGGGDDVGTNVDFGKVVDVDKSNTIANVQLRWKFGKQRKWSLWGQYFANDATGDATLEEDIEWQDVIFNEGTFVDGGVKFEIYRLFVGRSFVMNEQHDFGAGLGIHNLDLSAYIGGEAIINGESSGYQRVKASASQPLPNFGAWYNFSPAKRWLLHSRVDWIGASIGDYDGHMWNVNAGIGLQAWRHVGFDLSYQYFNLDVKVDKSTLRGGVEMTYSGPVVSVNVNW